MFTVEEPDDEEYSIQPRSRNVSDSGVVSYSGGNKQRKSDIFDYLNVPNVNKWRKHSQQYLDKERWIEKNMYMRKYWPKWMNKVSDWASDQLGMTNDWDREVERREAAAEQFTPKKSKPSKRPREPSVKPSKDLPPQRAITSGNLSTVGKSFIGKMPRRRRYGRRRFNRRRRGGRGGGRGGSSAVTFQRDAVNTYRARRVSRFARRRQRKAFKRSVGGQLRLLPNNIYRFATAGVCGGTALGTQGAQVIPMMYALYGDAGRWDDMQVLMDSFGQTQNNQANVTGTQTTAVRRVYNKLFFSKCTYDLDFTNTGATPCIVELYFLRSRMQGEPTSDPSDDFIIGNLRPTGLNDLSAQVISGGAGSANLAQYISPFDSHNFCAKWKIGSCKKLYLDPGKSSDVSLISTKRKVLTGSNFSGVPANGSCQWEGNTTAILMIVTGAPAYNAGSPVFSVSQVSWTSERSYNFKVQGGGLPMFSQN